MLGKKVKAELGDQVKDLTNQLVSHVVSVSNYLHGMPRLGLQPGLDLTGKPMEAYAVDAPQVIILKKGALKVIQPKFKPTVKLGDKVTDEVSGFEGILTGTAEFLFGCMRGGISPRVDKDGKMVDTQWIDMPQIKLVKAKEIETGNRKTGGPQPSKPTQTKMTPR